MAQLPIRALTLYKQGIGYFTRRGLVDERTVSLIVPRAATNDVLKSLNTVVHAGGTVLGVDYETPEDKGKLLDELSVKLTERASLVDLLSSLRGSRVTLTLTGGATVAGRLIGVEASLQTENKTPTTLLQTEDGDVRVLSITQLEALTLLDERARVDVDYFLDISRTERMRTTLTVRLTEGQHDLEIGYLAPSPVWRVSYRLMVNADGQAVLAAWGLFDNSLGEDLEDVHLTMISARPISFEYGLYESRVPDRPFVSDNPLDLEQAVGNPLMAEMMRMIAHDFRSPLSVIAGYLELLELEGLEDKQKQYIQVMRESARRLNEMASDLTRLGNVRGGDLNLEDSKTMMLQRSGPLGDLKASGSYFTPVLMSNADPQYMTYSVETPVSVKRGQSAMVPLFNVTITVEWLCVYNSDKMPNHPLLTWRFQNTTGFALEQGPITLVDGERYLGDGLLRFSGVSDDVQIPYALEFGVLAAEKTTTGERTLFGMEILRDKRRMTVKRARIIETTYTFTSRVSRAMTVQVERRNPRQGEFYEMPPPVLEITEHTRWNVEIPANDRAEFVVRVREISESNEDITSWSAETVENLRSAGLLSTELDERLMRLLAEKRRVADANTETKALQAEYDKIVSRQEQLRKNLAALGSTGREVTIREQVLSDLEVSENRRREIERRLIVLETEITASQEAQKSIIDEVYA